MDIIDPKIAESIIKCSFIKPLMLKTEDNLVICISLCGIYYCTESNEELG